MDQDIRTVITYPLDGSVEFDIPFDYLARKFVRVSLVADENRRLLSNITEYRFVSKTRVKILVDTTGFDRLEIRRYTSASERIVDFSDGSVLRAVDLNVAQLQSAHIAEEARDAALLAMPQDDAGNLDARNRRIVRLAPGIAGTDAVNKNQLDTTLGEAGGILGDIKDLQGEIYDYITKFADDTAMVKGVNWVYNSGVAIGGETVIKITKSTQVFAVPYLEVNGSRQFVGYQFSFNAVTQEVTLVKPLVAGDFVVALTTESHLPLEDLLAGATGAGSIGTASGATVEEALETTIHGTDVHKDTKVAGTLDTLLVYNGVNAGRDMRGHDFVMPHGTFSATRILRTRGITAEEPKYTSFTWRGQGSSFTKLVHPSGTGQGDIAYMDYLKDVHMSGFAMDNTALGKGTSNTDTRNGQFWIRHSADSYFDDLRFAGADALSFCLDHCKNIYSTNLKVDYQLRYPVGTGKSPLIVGDYSEQCMFIGGYVKTVSPDGTIKYAGDLADNDQADDTKWAFINLYGLKYEEQANSNACMWQEGQHDPSNAHFIGMNYINNGVGHGVSELAMGTDIGSTFRQAQVRAVWNRAEYVSVGGQFIDNDAKNPAGTGGSGLTACGAVHNDNAKFTSLVGDYFRGNYADYTDYTGATAQNPNNSTHITNAKLSSTIRTASSSTSQSLAIVNCQLTDLARLAGGGNQRLHVSVIGSHCVGPLGQFGHGQSETYMDVTNSTFTAAGSTTALVTQSGVGNISFVKCTIRDYVRIADGNQSKVTFESCTFFTTTFTEADRNCRYVNCRFIGCTNAPDLYGMNFTADSVGRPSSVRVDVTLPAGGSYTFPSWVLQGRGAYFVNVGGNGANLPAAAGIIGKNSASSNGVWTPQWEGTPGSVVVSWPTNSYVTITVTTAGNYTIGIH